MLDGELMFRYVPYNSYQGNVIHQLDFPLIMVPFEGDWYDAASIYREWVLPNA
jgi:hypothetical protein